MVPITAAIVGVVTETNAEKAIEELKAYEVRLFMISYPTRVAPHILSRKPCSRRAFVRPVWLLQADVATALRDGRLHVIPASELVPGDIVEIAGAPSWFISTLMTALRPEA